MDTSATRRSGWVSLCVSSLARMLLGVLASLLLWAVAPAVTGLHPTVVMTGSMLPRLVPGDVVFSRSVPVADLQLGQTLLYADPDQPGHLRMHRWIAVSADGRLVTKGDANPQQDSTPVDPSAVVGVASLRVPFVARPVVWVAEGRTLPLVLTGIGLLATIVAAFWFRAATVAVDDDETSPDDDGLTSDTSPGPDVTSVRWPKRLVQAGATLLVVVGLGGTFATGADAATAKFSRTTANPTDTWNAAAYFSCAGAARVDGTALAYPLDETAGTVANDIGPYDLDGTYAGGVTRVASGGPCGGRAVTLNGSTGQVVTPAAAQVQAPDTFTLEIWFRTATNYSRGGKLIGFETSQSGSGGQYDRHVYMTNAGTLVFGAFPNYTVKTVDSGTTRYNDGKWHLVDAVLGSAGMYLYVDGVLLDSDRTVTSAEPYTGWLRIGGGTLNSSWPSQPTSSYFGGSIADVSAYLSTLSASQIAGHYAVGKP